MNLPTRLGALSHSALKLGPSLLGEEINDRVVECVDDEAVCYEKKKCQSLSSPRNAVNLNHR
jgi:hypothetical protein